MVVVEPGGERATGNARRAEGCPRVFVRAMWRRGHPAVRICSAGTVWTNCHHPAPTICPTTHSQTRSGMAPLLSSSSRSSLIPVAAKLLFLAASRRVTVRKLATGRGRNRFAQALGKWRTSGDLTRKQVPTPLPECCRTLRIRSFCLNSRTDVTPGPYLPEQECNQLGGFPRGSLWRVK